MRQHPYLRAYMAGIAVPTPFLLVVMTGFVVGRLIYQVPIPIERVIVFPMAVIPNLWGLWNMLYVRLRVRWHIPIGIYGAALVLLIAPLGFAVARCSVSRFLTAHLLPSDCQWDWSSTIWCGSTWSDS